MTRLLLLMAVAALLAPGQAGAAAHLAPCGRTQGLECTEVVVPVDRSGMVPGKISLHVEVLPPGGSSVGAFFLIAGGPGQASARAFDLGSPSSADFLRGFLPGYTLVAVDNRGTGASGRIDCPGLLSTISAAVEPLAARAAKCAVAIGPSRVFYATRDHAEDLESVRQALGFDKIALFGVSYGTKLALAYSLAHPQRVERLLLDSVLPTELPDPFARNLLTAMPGTLASFCAGGRCRGATSNFPGDVAALANRAEAHPIRGKVLTTAGKVKVRMTGENVLGAVGDLDVSPGLAAELPAAVHAARKGFVRPLLRLADLDGRTSPLRSVDFSAGVFAATTCADGQFPWAPATPVEDRPAILAAAVAALAPGSLGPFGSWAAHVGPAFLCELWPSPAGRTPLAPGPFPNVPVLAVSGGLDLRTPTSSAVEVLRHFPQGQLLVTPGVGHSAVGTDLSLCTRREVRKWVLGLITRSRCPRAPAFVKTLTAFPRLRGKQKPRSTLAVAGKTVRESEAAWTIVRTTSGAKTIGLYGGKLVASGGLSYKLVRYRIAPGIRVSGRLRTTAKRFPLVFKGTLSVSGAKAAAGKLHVAGSALSGVLGGKRVAGHM